jgi:monolysocardiolipin acyltransferase
MDDIPQTSSEQSHAIRHWRPQDTWYKPAVCALVVQLSRWTMRGLNRLTFDGQDRWESAFAAADSGVLSFSNHVSLFDDPLLISNLGQTRYSQVRWIPADHLNFFGSWLKGLLFSCGKCVPIIRGGGLDQPGFTFLLERLRAGDWVHIFPEGGRTRESGARLRSPFKTGIGRLLVEAQPIAMPFYHRGMHEILPIGSRLPRWGNEVDVLFGEPTRIDEDWLHQLDMDSDDPAARRDRATAWAEATLMALERRSMEREA